MNTIIERDLYAGNFICGMSTDELINVDVEKSIRAYIELVKANLPASIVVDYTIVAQEGNPDYHSGIDPDMLDVIKDTEEKVFGEGRFWINYTTSAR